MVTGPRYLIALCCGLLTGCAASLPPLAPGAPTADCREFLALFDHQVAAHRVHDAQATPVAGFPYLRADRLLASLGEDHPTGAGFTAWVEAMRRLDLQARQHEWSNLPAAAQHALATRSPRGAPLETVASCGQELAAQETATAPATLLDAVAVPDDYQAWKRALGLYWLSAWPIKWGVERWHHETLATFATPLPDLPVHGQLVRYEPPEASVTPDEVRKILEESSHGPLGLPQPEGRARERLFAAFAPTWQVDTQGYDDRIGAPTWPEHATTAVVATSRPTVYRHLSHTRFQGHILAQLNYTVWFPARPFPGGKPDLLGGHLDGVTWRVTLRPDGRPLIDDTIHNCGCYHLFFPTPGLRARSVDAVLQEPAFVPQTAPELEPGHGPTLRLSHTAHFVERVTARPVTQGDSLTYQWAEYDTLRSLAVAPGVRHSLFDEEGIVPGTERGERWFFWTMGVPNPGEMRQWGHHATAFFGRRHFDDPFLMENHFEPAP